jgi:hypothetical protein
MASFIGSTIEDTQTSVTALGFAIAGAASELGGNLLVQSAGLRGNKGIGDTGLSFILRAAVSSAAFAAAATLMPASADNVLATFVYFASNPSLINDAKAIGTNVVAAIFGASRGVLRTAGPSPINPHGTHNKAAASCACGGNSAESCSCA